MSGGRSALLAPAGEAYQAAKLRWATTADVGRLLKLFSEARPDEPEGPEPMTEWLEHGGALMLEDQDGAVLCAVRWRELPDHGWRLDGVTTLPRARNLGFGRWLLTKVEALAIRYNVPALTIRLVDHEEAGYYRRLGYSREEDADGLASMRKRVGGTWQMQERDPR